ncbi:MAG: DUF3619 family protein [Gallionella sp.]|nr:DUF3619 family protein [Gallionella sp.]
MNNDSRQIDPKRIVSMLNKSTEHMDASTRHALQRARSRAMAAKHSSNWHDGTIGLHLASLFDQHRLSMFVLAIALIAGSTGYWHHAQQHAATHLDLAILTDDLPMEVFVDK